MEETNSFFKTAIISAIALIGIVAVLFNSIKTPPEIEPVVKAPEVIVITPEEVAGTRRGTPLPNPETSVSLSVNISSKPRPRKKHVYKKKSVKIVVKKTKKRKKKVKKKSYNVYYYKGGVDGQTKAAKKFMFNMIGDFEGAQKLK